MKHNPDDVVTAVLGRLLAGDPLAAVLVAAAVRDHPESFDAAAAFAASVDSSPESLERARALAKTRRDRQHLVIVECWLSGDAARTTLLARDHLASFPDDVVVSWLVAQQ
jgi:enterochelin esterase-like enzyme